MKLLDVLLWSIFKNTRKYDKLKADEEKRQTSTTLGVWAILSTIAGTILTVLGIWVLSYLFELTGSLDSLEALLSIVGIFLLIILIIVLIVQCIINGLVCAILQMKLNKKPIGVISLILWLAIIIAAIVIVAVVIF